ncbi:hypothetical protein PTI98_000702 [Pleurotus ostreatus]|nr:hypothetical protein PTI98_000702 [Pleurotus ostreatus]
MEGKLNTRDKQWFSRRRTINGRDGRYKKRKDWAMGIRASVGSDQWEMRREGGSGSSSSMNHLNNLARVMIMGFAPILNIN